MAKPEIEEKRPRDPKGSERVLTDGRTDCSKCSWTINPRMKHCTWIQRGLLLNVPYVVED